MSKEPVEGSNEKTSGHLPGSRVTWPRMGEIAWGLSTDRLVLLLAGLLVTFTVLSAGPLHALDDFLNTAPRPFIDDTWLLLNWTLDEIASRFLVLPVLGIPALYLAYTHRSWRPVVLCTVGVLGMSILVWGMKFVTGRAQPNTYDAAFFAGEGGLAFPSGHGANAILFYGLALYLLVRYDKVRRPVLIRRLAACVVLIAIVQTTVSVYLRFHWFTDLAVGVLCGAFVLALVIRFDRLIPSGRTSGWWPWREGDVLGAGSPLPQRIETKFPSLRPVRAHQPVTEEYAAPASEESGTSYGQHAPSDEAHPPGPRPPEGR